MRTPIQTELHNQQARGVLLVLTGPTGAGKDTLFDAFMKKHPDAIRIITTSSRAPRANESNGNPYYFISRDEFEQKIAAHEFFEWVEFRGELYGTQKQTLTDALASEKDVIWHIEAKGVKNIKNKVKEMTNRSVFVFLTTLTVETLEHRVQNAVGGKAYRWNEPLVVWEMEQYEDCEYLVINEDGKLDEAVEKVEAIMNTKRMEILNS